MLRKEEGPGGLDNLISLSFGFRKGQIELPPDCMSIQYKIGPLCAYMDCGRGICLDERILNTVTFEAE